MTIPAPSREKVIEKAGKVFPNRDLAEVLGWLDQYGREPYERDRVQLAILKLSKEDGLPSPERYVRAAKQDYRDVLACAEYPNEFRCPPAELTPEVRGRLQRADHEQYLAWLAE